jgi:hypothetical protein
MQFDRLKRRVTLLGGAATVTCNSSVDRELRVRMRRSGIAGLLMWWTAPAPGDESP